MGKEPELKGWYEFDNWISRMESAPVELVEHWVDANENYSIDRVHLFRLKNGKYALVVERGCSCYGSEDAYIDLFPDVTTGREAFERARKASLEYGQTDESHTARCKLCGAHQ